MTYTIVSARYANAEHSAALIQTQESGAVLASQADTPDLWQQMLSLAVPDAYSKSAEQIQADYTAHIQKRLDVFARTRGYDGILSAASYVTSTNAQFAKEGQYCVGARDATWAKGYEIMGAVQAGTRPMPTWAELEAELPALAWPA